MRVLLPSTPHALHFAAKAATATSATTAAAATAIAAATTSDGEPARLCDQRERPLERRPAQAHRALRAYRRAGRRVVVRSLKPVEMTAALARGSTTRPPLPQPWARVLPLVLGSGLSLSKPPANPPKAAPG